MKKLLLAAMLLFGLFAYSQSTHNIDFEPLGIGADWDWTVGDNGTNPPLEFPANPAIGGINTSATVAKFNALQTGAQWALCYTDDDGQFIFDATNTTVKIMVFKSVLSPVAIKFEGLSPAAEIQIPNTLINQWQELSFDFSAHIGKTFNRIVIIPDFAPRTEDHIIYFDNIKVPDGEAVGPLPEPTDAPPIPEQDEEDVVAIYTEVYNDLPGTNFNPNWSQSTMVTIDYNVAGNNTLKYENLNYQGTQFTNQDVSLFDALHVDFWTPNATTLSFFLISPGNEIAFPLTITHETWVSVDIPLSAFVPPVNLSDVFQFKVVGNGTVYFDNWYFWKEPTAQGTDATLSNLKVNGITVPGFSPLVLNYEIELPNGTITVPTVTATTNDPNATYLITNPFALPGTAQVKVTAQDGVTQLTYGLNYTIASPEPTTAPPVPAHAETDVKSFYSEAYTNVSGINFNPFWGQQTTVTLDYSIAGNNTLRYEDLDFQGTEFPTQDVSVYEFFHVDFWTANSTALSFFLISPGPVQQEFALTIEPETWVSVDIDLSEFSPPVNLADVFQFKVE
ncbi:MAG: cadherin-like beta sandwich domain-containing protein, partial [Bacteroidales bacterium]|nr:cadherin-like beta sandwich domain-containing protein [Bacteroidales bacterium]